MLLAVLLSVLCAVPSFAAVIPETSADVIYYEDGSYLTIELVTYCDSLLRTTYNISGHKTGTYRNAAGSLMWSFTVYGTFTYDGNTAAATDASYDYTIYDSAWTFKSGSASYSGATATASGKFNGGFLLNRSTSLSLTCAPDGTLS